MDWLLPDWGAFALLRRNLLVWRKLLLPSLLGNFVDPLLYLLALGYGLGHFVGQMQGMPYITFIASGIVASSAMNTATFEGLYSAYTRMAVQNTYLSILATPLQIGDIVAGELLWCAVKGAISALAIILVASLFSAIDWRWQVLLALPVILLTGFSFGAIALLFTALSRSYDFFMYYFTLAVTPMFLFCGVFYPLHTLPAFAQEIAAILPLTHAVALLRPLLTGQTPGQVLLHVLVLLAYAVLGYLLAAYLLRRRLLS